MIQLIDIHKSFDSQTVLDGLNLEIESGKITVIIGQSGGGKSILLKHMIGLIRPDEGEVLVEGVDIARLNDRKLNDMRKSFGMLFQGAALFDSMTVGENVAFPLQEHTRLKQKKIDEIVHQKLLQVGLRDVAHKMPSELSGGMRKRVGLARAIALDPKIILFDEPTTGLHFADIEKLLSVLHRLVEAGNSVLVIEHNLDVIKQADYIIDLGPEGGDSGGRVVASGSPEELLRFKSSYTAQFLRAILK